LWKKNKGGEVMGYRSMLKMLMLMAQLGDSSPFPTPRQSQKDELDGVDIDAEYELIQKKESCLSKRLRDLVEYRYKKNKAVK
jgi:hypothetical protein